MEGQGRTDSGTNIKGMIEQDERKGLNTENSKIVLLGKVNGGNKDHGSEMGVRSLPDALEGRVRQSSLWNAVP